MQQIKTVGVVGCGIMGSGIAQVAAQSGFQVFIFDENADAVKKAQTGIDASLQKQVNKAKLTLEQKKSVLAHIVCANDLADFAVCNLIIEAVFDKLEIKTKLFSELDRICHPDTILASNTSSLSIIDIAAATRRMDKVVGMHFFNPVPVMQLVEVVKSIATGQETLETAKDFGNRLGKKVIEAPDVPGFIHNRLTTVLSIAAVEMLERGLASRDDIDNALKFGSNFPMGRLELMDMVGLDTLLAGYENLYREYKDPRYAPPLLLKRMVAAGWLGRKSGRGFYTYDKDGNKVG
ncbi:MAG: 3-hydroxybutyryl-CoA dehydrogenase [Acidobacteria bacterium]|jgi:3-hydroxybutyryl-CoA dehydrogenase|nr:3-hydroxybutyryl-CoA dehydrogenase [Acidobacteriota bacterium]